MEKGKSKVSSGTVTVRNRPYGILLLLGIFMLALGAMAPDYWMWYLVVFAVALGLTLLVKNHEVLEIGSGFLTLYLRDDWGNVEKRRINQEDLISWSVHDDNNRLRVSYYDKASNSAKMQILSTANLMGVSRRMNKYYRDKLNSRRIANGFLEKLHEFRVSLFGRRKKKK